MVAKNLKHVCGHWHEHVLPGTWRTSAPYGTALVALVCPRCMARETALDQARDTVGDYHRELCSRQPAPVRLAPSRPPASRPFRHPLKPAA